VPTLELEDLSREALIVPREMSTMTSGGAATTVLTHAQPTQKILHFALGFDFRGLEKVCVAVCGFLCGCVCGGVCGCVAVWLFAWLFAWLCACRCVCGVHCMCPGRHDYVCAAAGVSSPHVHLPALSARTPDGLHERDRHVSSHR